MDFLCSLCSDQLQPFLNMDTMGHGLWSPVLLLSGITRLLLPAHLHLEPALAQGVLPLSGERLRPCSCCCGVHCQASLQRPVVKDQGSLALTGVSSPS